MLMSKDEHSSTFHISCHLSIQQLGTSLGNKNEMLWWPTVVRPIGKKSFASCRGPESSHYNSDWSVKTSCIHSLLCQQSGHSPSSATKKGKVLKTEEDRDRWVRPPQLRQGSSGENHRPWPLPTLTQRQHQNAQSVLFKTLNQMYAWHIVWCAN